MGCGESRKEEEKDEGVSIENLRNCLDIEENDLHDKIQEMIKQNVSNDEPKHKRLTTAYDCIRNLHLHLLSDEKGHLDEFKDTLNFHYNDFMDIKSKNFIGEEFETWVKENAELDKKIQDASETNKQKA